MNVDQGLASRPAKAQPPFGVPLGGGVQSGRENPSTGRDEVILQAHTFDSRLHLLYIVVLMDGHQPTTSYFSQTAYD